MKRVSVITLALVICSMSSMAQNTAVVSGKFLNAKWEKAYVLLSKGILLDAWQKDSVVLDKDGKFFIRVKLSEPGWAMLSHGDSRNMYLCPGDSLYITADMLNFNETYKVAGKGAKRFRYLMQQQIDYREAFGKRMVSWEGMEDPKVGKEFIIGAYNKENAFFLKQNKKRKFRSEFVDWVNQQTFYSYYSYLVAYQSQAANVGITITNEAMPADFYDFAPSLKFNTVEPILAREKFWALANYSYHLRDNMPGGRKQVPDTDAGKAACSLVFKGQAYEYAMTVLLQDQLRYGKPLEARKTYKHLLDIATIDEIRQVASKVAAEDKAQQAAAEKQAAEAKASGYTVITPESGLTFDSILAKYKGKVIYIDFWASWCGPCKQQMPYSQKLHKALEGQDVVFLYFSSDKNQQGWKSAISKYHIEGEHYLLGSIGQQVMSKYGIRGIPRYMLADSKGNIVNFNAPRPSTAETLDLIRSYIPD